LAHFVVTGRATAKVGIVVGRAAADHTAACRATARRTATRRIAARRIAARCTPRRRASF
jgi:hypothetical protein